MIAICLRTAERSTQIFSWLFFLKYFPDESLFFVHSERIRHFFFVFFPDLTIGEEHLFSAVVVDRWKNPWKPFHFLRFPTSTDEKTHVPSANLNLKARFFSPAKLERKNMSISSSFPSSSNHCKDKSTLTFSIFTRIELKNCSDVLFMELINRQRRPGLRGARCIAVFSLSSHQPDHLCFFSSCRWTAMRMRMDEDG